MTKVKCNLNKANCCAEFGILPQLCPKYQQTISRRPMFPCRHQTLTPATHAQIFNVTGAQAPEENLPKNHSTLIIEPTNNCKDCKRVADMKQVFVKLLNMKNDEIIRLKGVINSKS